MLNDDQIYSVITIKKYSLLSPGWTVIPATKSKRDIAIADYVRWNIVNMKGTFRNTLMHVLSASEMGFSITEKIWYVIDNNSAYNGLIGLKALKPKNPESFEFDMDKYGNIKEDGLIQVDSNDVALMGDSSGARLKYNKFIHYVYNGRYGNPFGRSDLRAAFTPWIEKKLIRRFRNIYLEKFGAPTVYCEIPLGATEAEVTKVKSVIKSIQIKSSFTVPVGFEVKMLEATRAGNAGYENAINDCNIAIAHAILMPDLMGFSGGNQPGSFALGKSHTDIFLQVLEKMSRDLEDDVVGEQVIRQLVDMNFKVRDYPRFKFEPIKRENRSIRTKIIAIAVDAGIIRADEPWIRSFIELPGASEITTKSEQAIDDPIMDKIDQILAKLEGPAPEQINAPTVERIGSRIDAPPSITPSPGRSAVEVQNPKVV